MATSLEELKKLDTLHPLVVHALRTPLTTIRMYSESLLTDGKSLTAQQKEYVQEIHDASVRMGEVLTVLDPTKPKEG